MTSTRTEIHNNALAISKLEGILKGYLTSTQSYIDASRKDIYSPGGLVDSNGNHTNQLKLQWGLTALIIIAIITFAITG